MRGADKVSKVYLQKNNEDFIVLVEDKESLNKWKGDSSVPLTDVINGFKVFTTHRQGAQGVLDSASNAILDASFGTHKVDDIIPVILREGQLQVTSGGQDRGSSTNDSKGSMPQSQYKTEGPTALLISLLLWIRTKAMLLTCTVIVYRVIFAYPA
ncbi:hypothetical protein TWF106_001013 [Orbilia oligospora]|uniref:Ribosome maturation protein SDO1/SBDS N-terminal domain-containing protein n=1 Tax=Orbilia oligospora TaxID=2813651 RepID=A0A6G1M144_ORBOL|nr:hypothetical protein TWF106_001013 [Orbilia oligospora]KAF3213808.1 hypothetical protein TWF679_005132 [Orbilia oligospora]KAF3241245.1 hypothetical protein TWF192_009246 [Orbilia oligospora]